jgi:hypothetical protein
MSRRSAQSGRRAGARAPAQPALAGLVGWYRADQGITIATGVSQWNDLSGTGNNATQGTGASQPTLVAASSALGGRPALQFSGSQFLTVGSFVGFSSQPVTMYIVTQGDTVSGSLFWLDGSSGAPGRSAILYNATGWDGFSGSHITSANSSTAAKVLAYVGNGASSALYLNSSATAIATGNAGTNYLSQLQIGRSAVGGSNEAGLCAEILIYTQGHAAPQLSANFRYLSARYGFLAS